MQKRSKQRDAIRAFVAGRTDHPTAEAIYQNIREEIPNISLATVYRNLSLLSEQGEIRRLYTENGPDRFDANLLPHDHFICKNCGCAIDLKSETVPRVHFMIGEDFDGQVESHSTYFYGLCAACLQEESAIAPEST